MTSLRYSKLAGRLLIFVPRKFLEGRGGGGAGIKVLAVKRRSVGQLHFRQRQFERTRNSASENLIRKQEWWTLALHCVHTMRIWLFKTILEKQIRHGINAVGRNIIQRNVFEQRKPAV